MKQVSEKKIQVPASLIVDVYGLLLLMDGYWPDETTAGIADRIETQLRAKCEAQERRKTFTQYKTAPPGETREKARKAYLDAAGIGKDWRTQKETQL